MSIFGREYRVINGDNTYIPITKTEYDYAKFLESKGDLTSINSENMHDTAETPTDQYAVLDRLGLTYDEKSAIMQYKGGNGYSINSRLRDGAILTQEQSQSVRNISDALKKFPAYNGAVYRYIGFITKADFEAFINEHKGKTITYKAFTSTSKSETAYEIKDAPYIVKYKIESTRGKDLLNIGAEGELEVPRLKAYAQGEELTYSQLTYSQRNEVIATEEKKVKKGEITQAEFNKWKKDFENGAVTASKSFQIIDPYGEQDEKMQRKILERIRSVAKTKAEESMRSNVLGE